MTRSYRKPFRTYGSPHWYKRIRAGQERARAKNAIRNGRYDLAEGTLAPWDEYETPTDGQKRYEPEDVRWSRK